MSKPAKIYDISPEITGEIAVFPGDCGFSREESLSFKKGHHLTLSSMNSTLHLGAHTDAPIHYHENGETIEKRPLETYLGTCQVVSIAAERGARISPEDLNDIGLRAPRILFKTKSFPEPNRWRSDFNSLSPELIEKLAKNNIILVGIDTPSVDPSESKGLESHRAIFKYDMTILEGLVLDEVPDGIYTLIALPLRIKGADASPVRAILVQEDEENS